MNAISGEILFYGGIAGMVLVLLAGVIIVCLLSRSRKKLFREFSKEYGGNLTFHR